MPGQLVVIEHCFPHHDKDPVEAVCVIGSMAGAKPTAALVFRRESRRRDKASSTFCYRPCHSTTRIGNRPDSHARPIVAIWILLVATWIWIRIGIGIRVVDWKRRKDGETEGVDNNDTVEAVKSIVSIEVVEAVESGCAV